MDDLIKLVHTDARDPPHHAAKTGSKKPAAAHVPDSRHSKRYTLLISAAVNLSVMLP